MTRPFVCLVPIDQKLGDQVRADLGSSPWTFKECAADNTGEYDVAAGDLTLLVTSSLDSETLSLIIELSKPGLPPVLVIAPVEHPVEIADALSSGATDVARFPVARAELTARVDSILRRQQWNHAEPGSPLLVLDSAHHSLVIGGRRMAFPPREWAILKMLIENGGSPVATVRLARTEDGTRLSRSTVVTTVSRLRNRLRQFGVAGIDVHAIPGRGYQLSLTLPVQTVSEDDPSSPARIPDEHPEADPL